MASPNSAAGGEDTTNKNTMEQITFRFCAECSNMLYPKEDEESHKLQYTCRTCQYTEEATTTCVFRDLMNSAAGETAGVTQDVGSDPTVGTARSHSTNTGEAPEVYKACHDPEALAVCLRCGCTLLHCRACQEPAVVAEYNRFAQTNTEFQTNYVLGWIRTAGIVATMSSDQQENWHQLFMDITDAPNFGATSPDTPEKLVSLLGYLGEIGFDHDDHINRMEDGYEPGDDAITPCATAIDFYDYDSSDLDQLGDVAGES